MRVEARNSPRSFWSALYLVGTISRHRGAMSTGFCPRYDLCYTRERLGICYGRVDWREQIPSLSLATATGMVSHHVWMGRRR